MLFLPCVPFFFILGRIGALIDSFNFKVSDAHVFHEFPDSCLMNYAGFLDQATCRCSFPCTIALTALNGAIYMSVLTKCSLAEALSDWKLSLCIYIYL